MLGRSPIRAPATSSLLSILNLYPHQNDAILHHIHSLIPYFQRSCGQVVPRSSSSFKACRSYQSRSRTQQYPVPLYITGLLSWSKFLRVSHYPFQTRIQKLMGKKKTSGFDFFTEADPTNGMVQYLNQADAISKGLVYVQPDNTTVLAVDDTTNLPPGTKRNS